MLSKNTENKITMVHEKIMNVLQPVAIVLVIFIAIGWFINRNDCTSKEFINSVANGEITPIGNDLTIMKKISCLANQIILTTIYIEGNDIKDNSIFEPEDIDDVSKMVSMCVVQQLASAMIDEAAADAITQGYEKEEIDEMMNKIQETWMEMEMDERIKLSNQFASTN